jgi:hypothetical protein
MSEEKAFRNPYDVDNMPEGGGLTREGVVIKARFVTYPMARKDGSAVIDERTGQPSIFTGLRVITLRAGDAKNEGREDKYEWSAGKKARVSADGELLLDEKGEPAIIYKSSNLGKALERLAKGEGGFDTKTLYPRVSVLEGARLVFEGVNKIGADGKPKTHTYEGKTYNDLDWIPVGYKGGAGSRAGAAGGNGATAEDLAAKAERLVVELLGEAGGSIARKDLIRAIGQKGGPDAIKVTTLVARADFHVDRPWTFDGTTLTLGGAA